MRWRAVNDAWHWQGLAGLVAYDFMRLSIGQYGVRLTCGLGLLLLPAVQQKVCAWPLPPETEATRSAESAPAPTSDEPSKRKKSPLTLAAMLPDVAPPRWPNHTHLSAVQRVRPLPVTTWIDGPTGVDSESGGTDDGNPFLVPSWPRRPAPQRLPTLGNAAVRLVRADQHVFGTSILKTGPPRA
jgi:hypothetical protein